MIYFKAYAIDFKLIIKLFLESLSKGEWINPNTIS